MDEATVDALELLDRVAFLVAWELQWDEKDENGLLWLNRVAERLTS
jgi:hypothetical protein